MVPGNGQQIIVWNCVHCLDADVINVSNRLRSAARERLYRGKCVHVRVSPDRTDLGLFKRPLDLDKGVRRATSLDLLKNIVKAVFVV